MGDRLKIIRPGGLVGQDRHPVKFMAGRKELSGQNHPVNLVHRDDLIALTHYLINKPTKFRTYHAVAKEHPTRKEFYTTMARKHGKEVPTFDPDDHSTGKKILRTRPRGFEFKFEDPAQMS
jgi:nucleoside-diphosphate-sugar epimerase